MDITEPQRYVAALGFYDAFRRIQLLATVPYQRYILAAGCNTLSKLKRPPQYKEKPLFTQIINIFNKFHSTRPIGKCSTTRSVFPGWG